jgi:predicted patatin/cPLA2 family phospholipase
MHASTGTKQKKKKLALILGGGGMSTSYTVGVLLALKKKFKLEPDIIIAGSGSAGTASYFVSGQFNSGIKNVWLKEILNPRFISGRGFFKKIDIDFLIDEIFHKKTKLNTEKIKQSKTILSIPMVNAKTGALQYFTNHDKADWFEVLRAGKAIPIFYNKNVKIGRGEFHDSHLSASPETHVKYARKLGATHIISVHCSDIGQRLETDFIESLWFFFKKDRKFRKKYYAINHIQESVREDNFIIFPSRKPFAKLLDTKREDIVDTIELGYNDVIRSKTLTDFINQYK